VAEYLSGRGTRVVVIAAPGAPENLVRCLQARCGLERGQITVVPPASGREEVLRAMTRAAGQATGLLLIWYIGPGALDASGQLALVTGASAGPGPRAAADVLPFAEAEAALAARRRNWPTLIVLDCPQAGQVAVTQPEWGLLAPAEQDNGSPAGAGALTSLLVGMLEHGIPAGPSQVTLRVAHGYLGQVLTASGRAPARLAGRESMGELILGPNPALPPAAGRDLAKSGPGGKFRRRARTGRLGLAFAGLAAVVVVLAVVTAMLVLYTRSAARPARAARSGRADAAPVSAGTVAGQLSGVSCTSPAACTAVGNTGSASTTTAPLAERWNGRKWTFQPTPSLPGTTSGTFSGVSCTSPTACTAVGNTGGRFTAVAPLAERWNGRKWSIQPTPRTTSGILSGVSCTSPTACTAVGTAGDAALAEGWNGSRWAIQPAVGLPGPRSGFLRITFFHGVSCTSRAGCTAVGQSVTTDPGRAPGTADYQPLAERWNGTTWAVEPMPAPGRATDTSLGGVQCTSATACTAVGSFSHLSDDSGAALAESWNGTRWTLLPGPVSPSPLDGLAGVSCASPTTCTAVGSLVTAAFGLGAGQWNGTQWTITTALPPAGEIPDATLTSVSCTSEAGCTAVGQSGGAPLAEKWDGTQWTVQRIPAPPAASGPPPVLYNLGGRVVAAWNNPELRPATFAVFADGSAAVIRMHWARWNHTTAVTSSATYYDRSGPCCTRSDQHYYKVTVTLSEVRYSGGPLPGSYFARMIIAGRGFRTRTYTYAVSSGLVLGGWTGGTS
jgi:hypothetical protein